MDMPGNEPGMAVKKGQNRFGKAKTFEKGRVTSSPDNMATSKREHGSGKVIIGLE